jgi:hypothetical protein
VMSLPVIFLALPKNENNLHEENKWKWG